MALRSRRSVRHARTRRRIGAPSSRPRTGDRTDSTGRIWVALTHWKSWRSRRRPMPTIRREWCLPATRWVVTAPGASAPLSEPFRRDRAECGLGVVSVLCAGGFRADQPRPDRWLSSRRQRTSDTLGRVRNTLEYKTYILHGDADDNVPVTERGREKGLDRTSAPTSPITSSRARVTGGEPVRGLASAIRDVADHGSRPRMIRRRSTSRPRIRR